MMETVKMTGRNWLAKGLLQTIIILALAVYGVVATIESKNEGSTLKEMQQTININSGRILRLETLMEYFETMPQDMAFIKANTTSTKEKVDNIEKKLDAHVATR